jgi:hypothetical protein
MFHTSKYKINVVYPKLELGSKFAIRDVVEEAGKELNTGVAARVQSPILDNVPPYSNPWSRFC